MGILTAFYLGEQSAEERDFEPSQVMRRLVDGLCGSWSTTLNFSTRDMKPVTSELWNSHFDHHDFLTGLIDAASADDFVDCEVEVTKLVTAKWLIAIRVMGAEADLDRIDSVASSCGFIEVRPENHERLQKVKEHLALSKTSSPLAHAAFDFAARQSR